MSDVKIENLQDFLTVEEAARLVGLSHWTIRMYLHQRKLTKYRLCSRTMVNRDELLALVHVEEIAPANMNTKYPGRPRMPPAPQVYGVSLVRLNAAASSGMLGRAQI